MLKRTAPSKEESLNIRYLTQRFETALDHVLKKENPDISDIRDLAYDFNEYARCALKEAGYESSKAAIARILGEKPPNYHAVLAGRRGSLDRICRWYVVWVRTWSYPELPDVVSAGEPRPVRGGEESKTSSVNDDPALLNATLSKYGARLAGTKP